MLKQPERFKVKRFFFLACIALRKPGVTVRRETANSHASEIHTTACCNGAHTAINYKPSENTAHVFELHTLIRTTFTAQVDAGPIA